MSSLGRSNLSGENLQLLPWQLEHMLETKRLLADLPVGYDFQVCDTWFDQATELTDI